jgi:hypothetical protein
MSVTVVYIVVIWNVSYCSVISNKIYFINQLLWNFLLRNFTKEIPSRFTYPYVQLTWIRGEAEMFISSMFLCQGAKYQRVMYWGWHKTVQWIYLKEDRPSGSSETGTTTTTTTTTYSLPPLLTARHDFSLSAIYTTSVKTHWRRPNQGARQKLPVKI